jgi:glycosyltransferase involved in cell wall biosynthesis
LNIVTKTLRHIREEGWAKSLSRAMSRTARRRKRDLRSEYGVLFGESIGTAALAAEVDPKTVNWVLPPIPPNSGGYLNALRFARMLEQRGFRCTIVVMGGEWFGTSESIRQNIRDWYVPLEGAVALSLETAPPARITIATSWQTAYMVRRYQSTRHKCYFIQDFEPWFSAAGAQASFAEATYRFGFYGITAGAWLAHKLSTEFGMRTSALGFSFDRTVYRPAPRKDPGRRVLFYGRPWSERRGFELGLLALDQVARRHPDVEFVFVGGSLDEFEIPFRHRCEGMLDFQGLAALYNECDAAVVLSMTNLSLLPIEIMGCGVPVVSNRAPWTEWLLDDDVAQLAEPSVEGVRDAICTVLESAERRSHLKQAGLAAAARTSWEAEGDRLAAVLSALD